MNLKKIYNVGRQLGQLQVRIQRGGQGVRTPPPPGKSQVIWVSLGNKLLDPLENVGPPWKMLDPLWNLEK